MTFKTLHGALLLAACFSGAAIAGPTLDRIRDTGHIRFAYLPGGKSFTAGATDGTPEGYGVEMWSRIADRVKSQLGLSQLAVDWIEVRPDNVIATVAKGDAD